MSMFDVDFLRVYFVKSDFFLKCVVKNIRTSQECTYRIILLSEYKIENKFDEKWVLNFK